MSRYDDEVGYEVPGTIHRPLLGRGRSIDDTIRWGDTARIRFAAGITGSNQFIQFLRMSLPGARVCTLSLNATLLSEPTTPSPTLPTIVETVFTLFIGVGSSEIQRRIGFSGLPFYNAPINTVVEMIPLQTLYVAVSASVIRESATIVDILLSGQVTPIESVKR